MRLFKALLFAGILYVGWEGVESITGNNIAYAEEHEWKKAVKRLNPDLYRRDSDKFQKDLETLQRFLWSKDSSEKDREIVLDTLVANLSLNGSSLPHSMRTSEEIRRLLVREGALDFKKRLEDIANDVSYETGMVRALERFCENAGSDSASRNNTQTARELIEIRKNYRAALQQQAELIQQAMFLLRWHYPGDIRGEIDYRTVHKKCKETLEEISQISKAVSERNFYGIAEHLAEYSKKHREAQLTFQQNLDLVRRQAETNIELNVAGQPLRKISYNGRLFLATREFAEDWEGTGGAASLIAEIQRGGMPETARQPQRVAARTETKEEPTRIAFAEDQPERKTPERITSPKRTEPTAPQTAERVTTPQQTGRWVGLPSRAELERRLYAIAHDQGIVKELRGDYDGDIRNMPAHCIETIKEAIAYFNGDDVMYHRKLCGALAPQLIPLIKQSIADGKTNSAIAHLKEMALRYRFDEKDKRELASIALRALENNNPRIKENALDALYYLEHPEVARFARRYVQNQDIGLQKTAVSVLARLQDPNIKIQLMDYRREVKSHDHKMWLMRNDQSLLLFGTDDVVELMQRNKEDFNLQGGTILYTSIAPYLRNVYKLLDSSQNPREKLAALAGHMADMDYAYKFARVSSENPVSNIYSDVDRQVLFRVNRLPPETAVILYDIYSKESGEVARGLATPSFLKKKILAGLIIDVLDELVFKPYK